MNADWEITNNANGAYDAFTEQLKGEPSGAHFVDAKGDPLTLPDDVQFGPITKTVSHPDGTITQETIQP